VCRSPNTGCGARAKYTGRVEPPSVRAADGRGVEPVKLRSGTLLKPKLLTPTVARLAFVGGVLALSDWGSELAGNTFLPGGPLDELAHLCTCLLVLWALGRGPTERFLGPALVVSVAIDLDHVPGQLGIDWLTAGTPRPYTHSLSTIAVVLVAALMVRRRRDLLLGIAVGLVVHFWRDLSEPGSGVSLLWPWSYRAFQLPHASYVAAMTVIVAVGAWQSRLAAARQRVTNPLRLTPAQERASATARGRAPGRRPSP
jgi:hypothetical protein